MVVFKLGGYLAVSSLSLLVLDVVMSWPHELTPGTDHNATSDISLHVAFLCLQ